MKDFKRARPLLGTFVEIFVKAESAEIANQAISNAFEHISDIENLLSIYQENSEISKLNLSAENVPLKINSLTAEIIKISEAISCLSDGIFDVVFSKDEKSPASFKDIRFIDSETIILNKKLNFDFGGIGKGFAVDKGIDSLLCSGIKYGGINAGGDLRFFGDIPQPIFIRSPSEYNKIFKLKEAANCAVATTANYHRRTGNAGRKDQGIINPKNGVSWNSKKSISVISKSCALSDALTKVVALLDDTKASSILKKVEAEAIILDF